MSDDTSGLRWPLALFFLFTLCGGAIGLVAPSWFGYGRMIPSLLIVAALLAGGALYFPHFWLAIKVPDIGTINTHINEIRAVLLGPAGNQDKLQAITDVITKLSDSVDRLNTRFNPGGDVRNDVQAIKTSLESGGVHTSLDTIKTQVSAGGELRVKIDEIAAKLPKTP